jgi:hypothetical protein
MPRKSRQLGRRVVATIEPDSKWLEIWRVRRGGSISDMVNLSRAKDAAISIALSDLNALARRDAPPKEADRRHRQAAGPATQIAISPAL